MLNSLPYFQNCPFCHQELVYRKNEYIAYVDCCFNSDGMSRFHSQSGMVRFIIDNLIIYHFNNTNRIMTEIYDLSINRGKAIYKTDQFPNIDYSDLKKAERQIKMLLTFQ